MTLEILKDGTVRALYTDQIDLTNLGRINVKRASHVEFNNELSSWEVISAKTKRVLFSTCSREKALVWEIKYYSPNGSGWKELTNGR